MAYHILSVRRHQIWVITCLSLPPSLLSLSHTEWYLHEGGVVRHGAAARVRGAVVNCTRAVVKRTRAVVKRTRAVVNRTRGGAAPPPTHLFLSFGEMFQWRKSSVCCFGALAPPSIALAPPSIALAPTLSPKICKSDSTKQSFNNF